MTISGKQPKPKTLLIVIGGYGMKKNYVKYKYEIKERYQARQIKPYALEFPRLLTKEEIKNICEVLKEVKYEIFTNCELVKQKLKE